MDICKSSTLVKMLFGIASVGALAVAPALAEKASPSDNRADSSAVGAEQLKPAIPEASSGMEQLKPPVTPASSLEGTSEVSTENAGNDESLSIEPSSDGIDPSLEAGGDSSSAPAEGGASDSIDAPPSPQAGVDDAPDSSMTAEEEVPDSVSGYASASDEEGATSDTDPDESDLPPSSSEDGTPGSSDAAPSSATPSSPAVSDAELQKFASAVPQLRTVEEGTQKEIAEVIKKSGIEEARFNEIYQAQQSPTGQTAEVSPEEQQTFTQALSEIQKIEEKSKAEQEKVIQSQGLQPERFMEILISLRQDPELRTKIQKMLPTN